MALFCFFEHNITNVFNYITCTYEVPNFFFTKKLQWSELRYSKSTATKLIQKKTSDESKNWYFAWKTAPVLWPSNGSGAMFFWLVQIFETYLHELAHVFGGSIANGSPNIQLLHLVTVVAGINTTKAIIVQIDRKISTGFQHDDGVLIKRDIWSVFVVHKDSSKNKQTNKMNK